MVMRLWFITYAKVEKQYATIEHKLSRIGKKEALLVLSTTLHCCKKGPHLTAPEA